MTEAVEFKTIDGMFIKQIHLSGNQMMYPQHAHQFDHSTLLARGKVVLWKEGVPSYFSAPSIIWIEKGIQHKFQTLTEDCLIYCLHNLHGALAPEELELIEDG